LKLSELDIRLEGKSPYLINWLLLSTSAQEPSMGCSDYCSVRTTLLQCTKNLAYAMFRCQDGYCTFNAQTPFSTVLRCLPISCPQCCCVDCTCDQTQRSGEQDLVCGQKVHPSQRARDGRENPIEQSYREIKQRYYPSLELGAIESAQRFYQAYDKVRNFMRPQHCMKEICFYLSKENNLLERVG